MTVVNGKGNKHQGRTCQQSLGIHRPTWEKGRIWDCPSSELDQGMESEVQGGLGRARTKLHKLCHPCPGEGGDTVLQGQQLVSYTDLILVQLPHVLGKKVD